MKKIFLIPISLIALCSCSELYPSGTDFIIKDVRASEYKIYKYHCVSIKGNCDFFMKDSANKYIVGDTLTLNLK